MFLECLFRERDFLKERIRSEGNAPGVPPTMHDVRTSYVIRTGQH